jgi:hypothetical protein
MMGVLRAAVFFMPIQDRYGSLARQAWGKLIAAFLYAFIVFVSVGCQVRLVSTYDESTDTMAKALQSKIDHQFQTWIRLPAGSPALRYDDKSNLAFYADTFADLSVLNTRVRAQPLNDISAGMVAEIATTLKTIEAFHKDKTTINPAALENAQGQIDFQFQRLVAFELDKQRGGTGLSK